MFKKKTKKLLIVSLLLAMVCTALTCTHVHDDECGYNPETETGCTHVCDIPSGHGIWQPDN